MASSNNNCDDSCDEINENIRNLFCDNSEEGQLVMTQELAKEAASRYKKGTEANDANDKDYNPEDDLIPLASEETNSSHEFNKFTAKRKRRSFTVNRKIQAIKMMENGMSKHKVAKIMNVSRRNVIRWWQDKENIKKFKSEKAAERKGKAKKIRRVYQFSPKWPEMEVELFNWIKEERTKMNPVSRRSITAKVVELYAKIYDKTTRFKVTNGWFDGFKKRNKLSSRVKTGNGQKIPSNAANLVRKFIDYSKKTIRTNQITSESIASMDEVPIYFDMTTNKTYTFRGDQNVMVRSSGNEKTRFTVILCAFANGNKLKPTIIFKNLTKPPKECANIKEVYVQASKGGSVTGSLMVDWLKQVWFKNIQVNLKKNLLMFDSHPGHLVDSVKKMFLKSNTNINVIPGGCTPLLQPGDVLYHRMFKVNMKHLYEDWLCSQPSNEKVKRPSYKLVTEWVIKAWNQIEKEDIKKAFNVCGLNQLDDPNDFHYLLKTIMTNDIGSVFHEDDMIGTVYENTGLTDDEDDSDDDEDNESSNELINLLSERDKFITENDDLGDFAFGSDDSNMEID